MTHSTTIAVDLAKSVFEIAVSHSPGRVHQRRRLSRARFLDFFAQQPPATILLEACSSSHYWARQLQQLGHRVILLPPHSVRPYRSGNKTDRADAKALLEAHRNQDIKPVPIKAISHHTLTALHRLRSAWLATRTARLNALRGLLRELGFIIPLGAKHVIPRVTALIEDLNSPLPQPLRHVLGDACIEIQNLQQRIKDTERQLTAIARQDPSITHLLSVPGIGLLTATALASFVTDIHRFPSGRHFASYLGLTPRESSSGMKRRLGRITKRGDNYLRMLLIHGARSLLWSAKRKTDPSPLFTWAVALEKRQGHNKATVALANKLARIAWTVWKENRHFVTDREAA